MTQTFWDRLQVLHHPVRYVLWRTDRWSDNWKLVSSAGGYQNKSYSISGVSYSRESGPIVPLGCLRSPDSEVNTENSAAPLSISAPLWKNRRGSKHAPVKIPPVCRQAGLHERCIRPAEPHTDFQRGLYGLTLV